MREDAVKLQLTSSILLLKLSFSTVEVAEMKEQGEELTEDERRSDIRCGLE